MANRFEELWHYHSEPQSDRTSEWNTETKGMQPMALAESDGAQFDIGFLTASLRPNHQVSLITEATGWSREIFGVYWYGAWRFRLLKSSFRHGSKYRFRLNGCVESQTLTLKSPHDVYLKEGDVIFPETPARYIHGYENLRVSEDQQQQNVFQPLPSEYVDWDIIVIGSGMGGGTLADALTDHKGASPRVLVLEAGPLEYDTHIYNKPLAAFGRSINGHEVRNYEKDNDHTSFGMFPQMNFGGRSLFWSGLIPRMKDWELAHWPKAIADDLREHRYDKAEAVMRKHVTSGEYQEDLIKQMSARFPGFEVVDTPRSLHQPEIRKDGSRPDSVLHRSTGTYSSAELLLDSLRSPADPGSGRLFAQCNHLVTELVTENGRVTEVVCQDLVGNRERRFRGKYVVLAAGSLESARLAMVSKLEPGELIGKGLTDHPSYYAPNDGNFLLKETSRYAGRDFHAKIFLYPKEQWAGHWFNIEIVINGDYWNSRHADDDVQIKCHPKDIRSTVNFKFIFGSPLIDSNWVALGGPDGKLRVNVPPNPHGENARESVRKLLADLMEFLEVEPADLNDWKSLHFGNGGTVNHAGGTLRTGEPGSPRVLDEDLKFERYENLYVCDPSAYPYIPAANPSLTLVALALRLGDHLIGRLQEDREKQGDKRAEDPTPLEIPRPRIIIAEGSAAASRHEGLGNMPFAGGTAFRVWAPFAKSVAVAFYPHPQRNPAAPSHIAYLAQEELGYWSVDVPGVEPGHCYRYQITNRETANVSTRIDPYAREVTNSIGHGIVSSREFPWQVNDYQMPEASTLVIYELHLGTFDDDPGDRPGTLARAASRLGHLADLGVNCIHVMPPNEFAADRSWGYNVALPFAIEEAYGGVSEFKKFVDEAHRLGLAVITDCVFNHFGPGDLESCLWQFDGWQERGQGGIYFYNDERGMTQWGPRPDFGREEVRRYIRDYVFFLLEECRCDGLRIDSTCNIWGFNNGEGWNPEGYDLLRSIADDVKNRYPHPRQKILIAEDWHNDGWVTRPTHEGGAGMDAEWHWFVHEARRALIPPADHERDMGSVARALHANFNGDAFTRVIYTESHDESGNDDNLARKIDRHDADSWYARKRTTLGAALLLTAPGIPMLWQGQEIHWTGRFTDEVPLDWKRLDQFPGIYQLYKDLCHLRRNWYNHTRGLRGQHLNCQMVDEENKVIAYHRWDQGGPGDDVIVILNFSHRSWTNYVVGLPREGTWECRFSSDWGGYGPDFGNHGGHAVEAVAEPRQGLGFHARFELAPYSAVIYSQGG
jgi:1,4-alpha-glucan branching enzyme